MHALRGRSTGTSVLTGSHLCKSRKIRIKNLPFRKIQKPVSINDRTHDKCIDVVAYDNMRT